MSSAEEILLVRELNHRVKNNLQLMLSMISLHRSQDHSDPEAILTATEHRIRTLAMIHEQLYRSDRPTEVDLSRYLSDMAGAILSTAAESIMLITCTSIETLRVPLDKAIPVGLIVNEIILNSLKYAFPGIENPAVSIDCHRNENSVTIFAGDNGVGMPSTDGLESVGFGTLVINALTAQLQGRCAWEGIDGGGTAFRLTFSV